MAGTELGEAWCGLSDEVLTGMKEWRLQHSKATWDEIEVALDERLGRLRAKMLEDMALASTATSWEGAEERERPRCPRCGGVLVARGKKKRGLQTQGGQEVVLERSYGECPACGAEVFPPG